MLLAAGAAAISACTALVSTAGLAGGADAPGDAGGSANEAGAGSTDAATATAASCRALLAQSKDAGSGTHMLRAADGGAFSAYCDMDTADGGWTLVTAAMLVEDRRVQDVIPGAKATVDVTRSTDIHGGLVVDVRVVTPNCGADHGQPGDFHYFLVGELDGWTEIRATYGFFGGVTCWNVFGDPGLPDTNVHVHELGRDLFDLEQNMARGTNGQVQPYSGLTSHCSMDRANFWHNDFVTATKTARVALRRASAGKPAGLAVASDCSNDNAWQYKDIFVR